MRKMKLPRQLKTMQNVRVVPAFFVQYFFLPAMLKENPATPVAQTISGNPRRVYTQRYTIAQSA